MNNGYPQLTEFVTGIFSGIRKAYRINATVYPNPASTTVYYRCEQNIALVQVLDVAGRVILQQRENKSFGNLDISRIQKGVITSYSIHYTKLYDHLD